jgi:hypothetical protein
LKKLILSVLILSLAACSFGSPVDNMLSPPMLSAEETAVTKALEAAIGSDYRLKFPQSGERRSAVIIENIDADPEKEAVVFYEPGASGENTADIHINIIDRNAEGEWVSVYDHIGDGSEIDRVLISRLGNSPVPLLILGFRGVSGGRTARIYSFAENRLSNSLTDDYVSMFITDAMLDGANELCLVTPNAQGVNAAARLISVDGATVYEWGQALLSPDATAFPNIAAGYVSPTTPALFIDGLAAGELYTDIVYAVENRRMRNPMYLEGSMLIELTKRPEGYLSTDIDLDGIVEIPTVSLFPGYNSFDEEAVWAVNWNTLTNYDIVKKYTSYYTPQSGYCFLFPGRWDGVVTVSELQDETVFYKYAVPSDERKELMRIAVSGNEIDKTAEGYSIISSKDDFIYWIKNSDDTSEPLVLTDTEIKYNFYILI